MAALEPAATTIESVLTDHPDVPTRRLDARHWTLVLPGTIRFAIPVAIELAPTTTTLTSFLLRGPRPPYGRPEALHQLLLRRNRSARRVIFALDQDDDVILVAKLPTKALSAEELEQTLAEILTVSESAFEALVHLAYPGVFRALPPRSRRTGDVAAADVPQAGWPPGRGPAADAR